jgi:tetratricopeptide (TPR) repeat protein
MSKKAFIFVIAGFFIIAGSGLLVYTVWGQSLRVANANQLFTNHNFGKAEDIYEDLAVDLPKSRVITHNLGLCYYQEGLYERSVINFTKCISSEKILPAAAIPKFKNADTYYYHLGNAYFKAASRDGADNQTAVKLFTAAVQSYKKALLACPSHQPAKYNYELAVLHLQQMANKPQTKQDPRQEANDMLQNTQNSEQFKAKLIPDTNPPNGKDW